ncbi:MAG: 2-oxo-tetronate isomerase [Betaproteobacteria bacterium]
MPKYCANLSFLFTEVPFPERFERAARAGFRGIEFMSPYEHAPREVAAWLRQAGLEMVLFNLPAGNWAGGERGLACMPGREADFRAAVAQALPYAEALACRRVHCLAGLQPAGEAQERTRERFIANLRYAAERFAALDAEVLIEPINSRIDMPDYWLDTPAKAFELLAQIDRPNVAVQLDIYHATVMGDDAAEIIAAHFPAIGHVQIADHPGRHEPGTGMIDFAAIFATLDRLAYSGWVGCEYRPIGGTETGLAWKKESWAG